MPFTGDIMKKLFGIGVVTLSLLWMVQLHALNFENPKLESKTEYPEIGWGAEIRMWAMIREGNGPKGLFLMQAEPNMKIDINEYLSTYLSFNLGGQPFGPQNAYGHIKLPESFSAMTTLTDIQFGLMHLPFGIRIKDHTMTMRTAYGFETYRSDIIVKIGRDDVFYYDLGYTNGGRNVGIQVDGGWGGFVNAGVQSEAGDLGYKLGASFLGEKPNPINSDTFQQYYAVYTDLSMGRFRFMAEFDLSQKVTPGIITSATTGETSSGYFGELFFDILDNLNTSFRYDYFVSNLDEFGDGLRVLQLSLRWRLLTYLTLEPVVRYRVNTRSDISDPADNSAYLLVSLMF
jgi:hypothetical protein